MESLETCALLVDDQLQIVGDIFPVVTSGKNDIGALKVKVKEYWKEELAYVPIAMLSVWRWSDKAVFEYDDLNELQRLVSEIFSRKQVEALHPNQNIANLNLSEEEVLLVEVPRTVGIKYRKYEQVFLYAYTRGQLTVADFYLNNIAEVTEKHFPEFLKLFEMKLGRKRMLLDEKMRGSVETVVGATTSKSYFQLEQSMADSPESIPVVSQSEFNHIAHISSVDGVKLWATMNEGNRRIFKEADALWLFFYFIGHHLESHPSREKANITVRLGQCSWPFLFIIQVEGKNYTHQPKSDFLVLKSGLPRVAAVVNSHSDRPPVDHHRLMLQATGIVRFANTFLDAYKENKNFVFVAIFIDDTGLASRYFLYQGKSSDEVYRRKRIFEFSLKEHRIEFALEMYNLSSALIDEREEEDTKAKVEELLANFNEMRRNLSTFTSKNMSFSSNDEENQPGISVHQKSNDSEHLEACGYEVVPDVFETDGGTWELLYKLPPHIRSVYRRSDLDQTKLIAKRVRMGSNELTILEYLHRKQPRSQHIISLLDAIPSINREWLILPRLHSICEQRIVDSGGVFGRIYLGRGLIKGLAYLHEHKIAHRDIKPDNLVCDSDFRLQIIDFDMAIEVQDENTEIDEYRGTKDWTAPEIGKGDEPTLMHSPIKADRWSCGRVLLHHIMVGKGLGDNRLSNFAGRLMANDPQQRPSLLEWHKVLASPFSDVTSALEDGKKRVFKVL